MNKRGILFFFIFREFLKHGHAVVTALASLRLVSGHPHLATLSPAHRPADCCSKSHREDQQAAISTNMAGVRTLMVRAAS